MDIQIKRIYDDADNNDGTRILVDRVWPRGVTKENAHLDDWMKEIAPTTELRKWFGHKEERFKDFSIKYAAELENNMELIKELRSKANKNRVTLLYGAKDETHNQAIVLKKFLLK